MHDKTKCKKKFLFLTLFFLIGTLTMAQPSDATILSKLKSTTNSARIISVQLEGTRGGTRKEVENGVQVTNFYRTYLTRSRTEYEGIVRVYRGMVKYGYRNGSWKYLKKLVGENNYEGIPNPTWEELEPFLMENLNQTMGSFLYGKIVGSIESLTIADEPNWNWESPKSVTFQLTAVYTWKKSNVELERVRNTFKVKLFADEVKGPWTKVIHGIDNEESLEITRYPYEEVSKMKTLRDEDLERKTKNHVSSLPVVEIPSFENHAQLILHFHELMRSTTDEKVIEAYLRKMLVSSYFYEELPDVPTERGAQLIENTINALQEYQHQYCEEVMVKHNQSNMLAWYNKDASKHSRISSVDLGNGKRAITDISIYVYRKEKQEHQTLSKLPCQEAPPVVKKSVPTGGTDPLKRMKAEPLKSVMGAYVFSKKGNSEWYFIGQLDGASKEGYRIKWMDGTTSNESPKTVYNYGLKENDIVYATNKNGKIMKLWISENNGTTIVKVINEEGIEVSVHVKDLRFKSTFFLNTK